MKAIIYNDKIEIINFDAALQQAVDDATSYTDKAKQYELKRAMHNPWSKNTLQGQARIKKLKEEVHGSLMEVDSNKIYIPSGFSYLLRDLNIPFEDKRKFTGAKIALPWKNKPYDPRDYQKEAVDAMKSNYRGVINFATGLGKTLVAVHAIRAVGKKTLVVVPSESIAKQFYKDLVDAFGDNRVGYFGGGKKKISDITIGIVGSLTKSIETFQKQDLGLIIFDETHHIAANTFFAIAKGLAGVGQMFGLTATDYRSDGKDILINAGCGEVLLRRDISWGVKNKWLAEPFFFIRKVSTQGQDMNDKLKAYKEHVLNNDKMKQQIKDDAKKFMEAGKKVLVLVDQVEHGEQLAKDLNTVFAHGGDDMSSKYVEQFNAGKLAALVGTDGKIGEGTDTKAVEVLIMANFAASKGPVIQCVGRGLRRLPNKDKCIILDYVPAGSSMLARHAEARIGFYKEITNNVKIYT